MFHTVNRIVMLVQIAVVAIVTYVFTIYILPLPVDEQLVSSACEISESADRYRSALLGSCNNGDIDCSVEILDDLQDSETSISKFDREHCAD